MFFSQGRCHPLHRQEGPADSPRNGDGLSGDWPDLTSLVQAELLQKMK